MSGQLLVRTCEASNMRGLLIYRRVVPRVRNLSVIFIHCWSRVLDVL